MSDVRRGANIALTREVPTLDRLVVGVRFAAGAERELLADTVLLTLLCDRDSKLLSPEHAVFFNQLTDPDGSLDGGGPVGGSDTEQVAIQLSAVPAAVHRIVIAAYLNRAFGARRSLGQLSDCVVRAVNGADGVQLVRSENLATEWGTVTAATLAEVYRHESGWKFKVLGDGYAAGIAALAADHGLPL